jgi:hypothetical protein
MEDNLYYAVAAAALLGIALVVYDIATTPKPTEEFTELYFLYERQGLEDGRVTFRSVTVSVDGNEVWMDFDGDRTRQTREVLFKGDTFALQGDDWHISDLTDTEILFAAYPKEKPGGHVTFSFCIGNRLGRPHAYTYSILLDDTPVTSGQAGVGADP